MYANFFDRVALATALATATATGVQACSHSGTESGIIVKNHTEHQTLCTDACHESRHDMHWRQSGMIVPVGAVAVPLTPTWVEN